MKIYLAGSSAEMERVDHVASQLVAAGVFVVSTWPVSVRRVGDANPRAASVTDRQRWSVNCLAEIQLADVLWLLVPAIERPTRGGWGEFLYGVCAGKKIISSGDTRQSIFTSLGAEFETDDAALTSLIDNARLLARQAGGRR